MIFKPELVNAIKEGRKTMTRRPVKGDCRYKPGRVYAVQPGRGAQATAHITVLAVGEERLDDISPRDARREGFRSTQDFKDYWAVLYGSYSPDDRVWVILFTLGDQTDKPRLLAARPGGTQGDYTSIPARAMHDAGEEVGEGLQDRFASAADEDRRTGATDHRDRLLAAVSAIRLESTRLNAGSSMARRRLKTIEHNLRALQHEWRRSA